MKSNSLDLLWELIKTNFKLRYNNSFLGFVWVLIKPFALFTILYFVWTAFRGNQVENYQVKLLLGIILFNFVNEGVIFGMNGLLDKAHIILKVSFPREIAVLSSVAMAVINLLINLIVFFIFCIFNPVHTSFIGIIWFILWITIGIFFIYGLSLYSSIILIKLRDLQHILELFFSLLFWATPIFYEIGSGIGQISGKMGNIISLNPLGWLIQIARHALINGEISNLTIWGRDFSSLLLFLIALLITMLLVITGRFYFNKQVKKVAEYF